MSTWPARKGSPYTNPNPLTLTLCWAAHPQLVLMECPSSSFRTKLGDACPQREPPAPGTEHFIYNYTIKENGTHAMEITFLQDAQMWPHLTDCGFVQDITVSGGRSLFCASTQEFEFGVRF